MVAGVRGGCLTRPELFSLWSFTHTKTLVPLSKGYKERDLWAIAEETEKPQTNYFLMLQGKVAFNSFAIAAQ